MRSKYQRQKSNIQAYYAEHREEIAEYQYGYHSLWHWVGRMEMIERLGGCCATCGYKQDLRALQIDHIDPNTKIFKLSLGRYSAKGFSERHLRELEKCQLLCANCHAIKSHMEGEAKYG